MSYKKITSSGFNPKQYGDTNSPAEETAWFGSKDYDYLSGQGYSDNDIYKYMRDAKAKNELQFGNKYQTWYNEQDTKFQDESEPKPEPSPGYSPEVIDSWKSNQGITNQSSTNIMHVADNSPSMKERRRQSALEKTWDRYKGSSINAQEMLKRRNKAPSFTGSKDHQKLNFKFNA